MYTFVYHGYESRQARGDKLIRIIITQKASKDEREVYYRAALP